MAKTVLIVEDNELNMKLFHDLLEAHGYCDRRHPQRDRGAGACAQASSRPDHHGYPVARSLRPRSHQMAEGRSGAESDPGGRRHGVRHEGRRGAHPRRRLRGVSVEADLGGKVHRDGAALSGNGLRTYDRAHSRCRRYPGEREAARSAAHGGVFRRHHRDVGRRGARDLRARAMRHRAARRDDAGDGRLRGLPPAQGQSGDAPHSGRDGDGARPAVRPRARARGRRRRFPHQAGVRHRAARARALAGAAEDGGGRIAHARRHVARDRHQRSGIRRRHRDRPEGPRAAGRRQARLLRAARRHPDHRAHRRCRAEPAGSAVPRGGEPNTSA